MLEREMWVRRADGTLCGGFDGVCAVLDTRQYAFVNPDLSIHLDRPPCGEWLHSMLDRRPDSKPVTNAYSRRLQLYRGEIGPDAVVTPADTDDVQVALDGSFPVAMVVPDQGAGEDGLLLIPNTVSLVAGAPHPDAGRRVVDFLLSEDVEALHTRAGSGQVPLRASVPRPGPAAAGGGHEVADAGSLHHLLRGVTEPETLEDVLLEEVGKGGTGAAESRYRELHKTYYGSGSYDFRSRTLDEVAEALASEKKDVDGAIALMKLNLEFNPDAANSHLMLAQLYSTKGDNAAAVAAAEKALALDPGNHRAKQMLERLRAAK